ncbi:MAG: DUF1570 domain-containing protein [Archangium sp.]|nr:DUF1570 domain-containing protein [Archangium sp.]
MRSLMMVVVVAMLTGCTVGTGSVVRDTLRFWPSTKAQGWKKIVTPEFELLTDLDTPEAQRAASLIAQSLAGLNAMFARAPVAGPVKVTVIAMRDGMDFERRFSGRVGGFAVSTDSSVTLVLYGTPDKWFVRQEATFDATESVVNHELAHAVLRRYFTEQNKWFAEGMAEYLETFRWLDAETVQLGDPNLSAYRAYRAIRSLSVKEVLAWDSYTDKRDLELAGYYGLAWAFVHYLRNKEPQALGKYMADLARSGPRIADQLLVNHREDEFDKAIFAYMKAGSYQQFTLKVPLPPQAETSVEAMSSSEREAVEATLQSYENSFRRK